MTDEVFEYTRRRANIQLGDGPDQRGEITIETVRAFDPDAGDRQFAEWHLAVQRAVQTLRSELDLPEADEEIDVEVSHG